MLCFIACFICTRGIEQAWKNRNKTRMATGCEIWTFLVYNLTGSRTHFRIFETIHPFSKSNQGKSNLERIWLGTWETKKTFYDSTFITENRKRKKRIEKKIEMIGLISHFKWKIWISYWTIKNKACTQFVLYYSSLI